MNGMFGVIAQKGKVDFSDIKELAKHSKRRGTNTSGIIVSDGDDYKINRADFEITKLLNKYKNKEANILIGNSRLGTGVLENNQPVVRDNTFLIHSGIILNSEKIWNSISTKRHFEIDSEIILALALEFQKEKKDLQELTNYILSKCKGIVSAVLGLPLQGKLLLFSNNGSLYVGEKADSIYFSAEKYPLEQIECLNIRQIREEALILDIPNSSSIMVSDDNTKEIKDNTKAFIRMPGEEKMLQYVQPELKRCTKCILPETMPYIKFDSEGVCNYCNNYKVTPILKPKEELFELVKPYRRELGADCIVPFSGGRDSCYSLHIIVKELKMKPITYTYDWGMGTDLSHRNISLMCAELGVENIIVGADIIKKRENITKNLKAWLKSPHLGMINIFTAGDKHFFKYVENIKKETGINLNLWGTNPLETTHFKTGFLGVKPKFEEKKVYSSGLKSQAKYHSKRLKAMMKSPGYFNTSIADTLAGEYYRSFTKKTDYFHVFDYWEWDEKTVNNTLATYGWERATDTNTTWRIGDGTAGLYNYIFYTVAGFTEHDTFRSNQIREGKITREKALELVREENKPRYESIRWYLDVLGMDYSEVINVINAIPKLHTWKE